MNEYLFVRIGDDRDGGRYRGYLKWWDRLIRNVSVRDPSTRGMSFREILISFRLVAHRLFVRWGGGREFSVLLASMA